MRKLACLLLTFFLTVTLTYAETDNPNFLPKISDFNLTDVYFEGAGGFAFPLYFTSKDSLPMTNYGGLFAAGAGYNFSGWLLGLEYNRSMWGQGISSGALMNHFENNLFSFRIRRLITHSNIKKLPRWLNLAPGLSFGVDCITTNYYPSIRAKNEGRSIDVAFGQENARCFFGKISFETDFYFGTDLVIPFINGDWNTFYDTSIGGGFASFFTLSIGIRSYPLGLFHKNKLLEKDPEEIVVTEEVEIVEKDDEEVLTEEVILKSKYPDLDSIISPINTGISASIHSDFTPDGDGLNDEVEFSFSLDNISQDPESWKIEIFDENDDLFRSFSGQGSLPEKLLWNGMSDAGLYVDILTNYTAKLTVIPSEIDRNHSGQNFVEASDTVKSGILLTVIIPNKKWKIVLNTIHFDPDRASFNKISESQRKENYETLDSLAYQFSNHPDCSVIIEGYANNVSNTEKEDLEELIPLSQSRADAILRLLVERNVDSDHLSAKGLGGANPIAEWKDTKNWWKNRRVEFVIEKSETL
ncbi:MAG: OmpA family protein [Treponema sp.]|nr:OmpA family protein [Treponema sp.]